MDEEHELDRAAARLLTAVEGIEEAFNPQAGGGGPLRDLKDRLHYLEGERVRLMAELEAERKRGQRLEAANDEVSARLDALSRTLRPEATAHS